GIRIERPEELKLSVNGERLNDYEMFFNDLYFDPISKAVGHDKWGVWFKQIDEFKPKFIIDIYPVDLKNLHDYLLIRNIIEINPPRDMEIEIMAPYWDFERFVTETG
ncbi:MAG TPA: hypothetical protein VMI12_14720, partial [Puia sp.]|nr:hypothetical protein [Puia sp.]